MIDFDRGPHREGMQPWSFMEGVRELAVQQLSLRSKDLESIFIYMTSIATDIDFSKVYFWWFLSGFFRTPKIYLDNFFFRFRKHIFDDFVSLYLFRTSKVYFDDFFRFHVSRMLRRFANVALVPFSADEMNELSRFANVAKVRECLRRFAKFQTALLAVWTCFDIGMVLERFL